MASKKLQQDELKARGRIPDTMARSIANFGGLLAGAFNNSMESLVKVEDRAHEEQRLLCCRWHLSWLQMPSKEELCVLQTHVPLTTSGM